MQTRERRWPALRITGAMNAAVIRVLFVDDDPLVRSALRRVVRNEDYECWFAGDGEQALSIVAEEGIHVVVSDQDMPGMSGLQLLTVLRETLPLVARVLLTGQVRRELIEPVGGTVVQRLLGKPWENAELRAVIADVVATLRDCGVPTAA